MLDISYTRFLFEELTYIDKKIAALSVSILNTRVNDFFKKELAIKVFLLNEQREATLAELYVIADEVWQLDQPLKIAQ